MHRHPREGGGPYFVWNAMDSRFRGNDVVIRAAALRLDPNNPQLHYSLAYWLEKQGDRNEALGEFRTAYTLSPENLQFKRAYERLSRKPKAHRASGARKPAEGV